MIFLIVIGAVMLVVGLRMLWTLLQFYFGWQRELYFQPNHAWVGTGRLGGVLCIVGVQFLSIALVLPRGGNAAYTLGSTLVLLVFWWLLLPILLKFLPPRWLSQLERGRSPEDIEAIRMNGASMLLRQPDQFRRVIRDAAGWENWLMTVTEPIPVGMLDMFVRRAQFAMQHNLHPVAISAAEEIIRYRPNHALGYYLRALASLKNHQHATALRDLDTCLRLQPHDADLYVQRGRVHLMLGQTQAGLADLAHALALHPEDVQVQLLYKSAQKRVGQP